MAQIVRRVLGMGFDGKPIYAPKHAHSLLLSAAGGGKTTCGAVPWLQSMIADFSRAIVIADSKEGEIAAQCADMCAKYGRKVAIIDDFGVLGDDNPYRVSLNRFGSVISAFNKNNGELIFSTENACHALIEEPPRDQRNAYWRDEPRTLIEFVINALLKRNARLATAGGVWGLIANPRVLIDAAKIEAEEGDEALSALAHHVLGMTMNEEHFPQHRAAAMKAIRSMVPAVRFTMQVLMLPTPMSSSLKKIMWCSSSVRYVTWNGSGQIMPYNCNPLSKSSLAVRLGLSSSYWMSSPMPL